MVAERARRFGIVAAILTVVLYAVAGVVLAHLVNGYVITSNLPTDGVSNPLLKTVSTQADAWLANYAAHPLLWAVPAWAWQVRCWRHCAWPVAGRWPPC